MTQQQALAMLRDDNLWTPQAKPSLKEQGLTARGGHGTNGLGWRDAYSAGK